MKRFLLGLATVICIGLGLAVAQNINRSIQLSQSPLGPINVDTVNGVYFPAKVNTSGSAPTLAGGGTSASVSGSDTAGEISIGTGTTTTATITFRTAYTSTPYCTWGTSVLSSAAGLVSPSGINFVWTSTGSATGSKLNYICIGRSTG